MALELIDALDRKLLSRDERHLIREISAELVLNPSENFWSPVVAPSMSAPPQRRLIQPGVSVLEAVVTPKCSPLVGKKMTLNQIGRCQLASMQRARARGFARAASCLEGKI